MLYPGIIRRYRSYLSVAEASIVTLHEGATPLFESLRLKEKFQLNFRLLFKLEGLNPTGSFKDRGMTYAVSKAKEAGSRAIICASTGNTSAAAAAYAARGGMEAVVVVPEGKIAKGKLAQSLIHGAKVFQVQGNFDEALDVVREIAQNPKVTLVNSVNPYRLLGQQSAAFEIVEALGEAPDYHFIPVGNAGNITAYWRGFQRFFQEGRAKKLPQMCGFQAAGSAPIVRGAPVKNPHTIATAIRIGNPANWQAAIEAVRESSGFISEVTDEEILKAYTWLAQVEGVFCEPASAASVAGVLKMAERGFFKNGDVVTCTLTGNGLKDPDTAMGQSAEPYLVPPRAEAILEKLDLA